MICASSFFSETVEQRSQKLCCLCDSSSEANAHITLIHTCNKHTSKIEKITWSVKNDIEHISTQHTNIFFTDDQFNGAASCYYISLKYVIGIVMMK